MKSPTQKYKRLYVLFTTFSIVCTLGPLFYYIISALCSLALTHEKVVLVGTIFIALILTILNIFFKYHIRSTLWILVLGIYVCIDKILAMLILIAIGTILDEFIFTPLKNKYKSKKNISTEIDKRI